MGRKKFCFVCIDGIGDVDVDSLGGKTTLQAAQVPTIDALAAAGINGLMDPVEPGLGCGSDTAHMNMFGYDPRKYYRGRGSFEAMGAGLHMDAGDIAFKSNFATLDPATNIVVSRRADRHFEHIGPTLCDFLDGIKLPSFPDHTVSVKYATEHRCGVRVSGKNLTDSITGTDPLKDNLPLLLSEPTEDTDAAKLTAKLVNELSKVLSDALTTHPINLERAQNNLPIANVVLLRGCGERLVPPQFFTQRHGGEMKGFMIAPTAIIAGVGMSIGIDVLPVAGATGDYRTDLSKKAEALLATLAPPTSEYNFGFVHVKAVDDAGHDFDVEKKLTWLANADAMLKKIIEGLKKSEEETGDEFFVGLTGDHTTIATYGDHTSEPVPFAVARVRDIILNNNSDSNGNAAAAAAEPQGKKMRVNEEEKFVAPGLIVDNVKSFDEVAATHGALGRFTGADLMNVVRGCLQLL